MTKLSEEAKEFVQNKTAPPKLDKTALRFYAGNALAGLIPMLGGVPPEEVVNQAFGYAKLMMEKEKDYT